MIDKIVIICYNVIKDKKGEKNGTVTSYAIRQREQV